MSARPFRFVSFALACLMAATSGTAAEPRTKAGDAQVTRAREFANRGEFENAVEAWQGAAREFAKAKDADAQAGALLGAAEALARARPSQARTRSASPMRVTPRDRAKSRRGRPK